MSNKFSFNDIDSVVNGIRDSLATWQKRREDSNYDKLGVGFNKDDRFSVAKFELSLDSWSGVYGNSSCSTFFNIHNSAIFRSAFIRVLNIKLAGLLAQTADLLDGENREARTKKIAEMELELAELKAKQEKGKTDV